jgi:transposase-like protein
MVITLALFGNKVLRSAIQRNMVSFPAQVPVFAKHRSGEVQARISQLYFVCGWTVSEIGKRYGMSNEMVRKSLTGWRVRAISSGFIQEIEPAPPSPVSLSNDATEDAPEPEDTAPNAPAEVVTFPAVRQNGTFQPRGNRQTACIGKVSDGRSTVRSFFR